MTRGEERMRAKPAMLAILLLAAGWMFGPGAVPAHASCAELLPPETALKRSDAVFSGIVLSVEERNRSAMRSSADPVNVTFRVTEAWKGVRSDRVTVRTTARIEGRVSGFAEGRSYIVYADRTLLGLSVGPCTRTADLALAADDLAALGKGKVPPTHSGNAMRANPAVWAGAFAAIVAAAFLAHWPRRRIGH